MLPGLRRAPPAVELEAETAPFTVSDLSDYELQEKIQRLSNMRPDVFDKLPDKGQKMHSTLQRCLEELERRNLARIRRDVPQCQRATGQYQSKESPDRSGVGSNCTPTESNPQTKLEDKTDAAFCEELRFMGRDKYRSLSEIGLQEERQTPQKSPKLATNSSRRLSSRKSKQRFPNYKFLDDGWPSISSSLAGKSLSRRLSQRRRAANRGSTNLEFEEVQHVFLVDDEDVQPKQSIQGGGTSDNWEDYKIYYPSRDDPECVELSYSDLKCLDPESYLSSPVMNFYIQYLQRSPSLMAKRKGDFYIFNTYFYSKLEEALTCKDDKIAASFLKLRRWWKGVDIFQKSYIFLPIHGDMHWSLAIICIPAKEDESGLLVLHLDSLGLHGSSHIFTIVASYLVEELLYLNQNGPPDLPISGRISNHLRHRIEKEKIPVPQQKNEYDCGLFVLYFMQRFVEEAPERLKKKDLIMFGRKWFQPEEASGLRTKVRELVIKEFERNMLEHEAQEICASSSASDNGEKTL